MNKRLHAIRERWSRVSPTPWKHDSASDSVISADGTTVATHSVDGFWAGSGPPLKPEDAAAIAAAPADVAFLLRLVEQLTDGGAR